MLYLRRPRSSISFDTGLARSQSCSALDILHYFARPFPPVSTTRSLAYVPFDRYPGRHSPQSTPRAPRLPTYRPSSTLDVVGTHLAATSSLLSPWNSTSVHFDSAPRDALFSSHIKVYNTLSLAAAEWFCLLSLFLAGSLFLDGVPSRPATRWWKMRGWGGVVDRVSATTVAP
ncbi:hypothetical protein AB1N83_011696 [Pleurotus pulmonarius]